MRDKAVENVWRDYERIVLMPLAGAKIGLALMFEDLVKQGVVKKHRVRTGEEIKLDEAPMLKKVDYCVIGPLHAEEPGSFRIRLNNRENSRRTTEKRQRMRRNMTEDNRRHNREYAEDDRGHDRGQQKTQQRIRRGSQRSCRRYTERCLSATEGVKREC